MQALSKWLSRATIAASMVAGLTACGDNDDDPPPPETHQVALTGEQEAPAVLNTAANGSAVLTLNRSTRTISATLQVDGVVPTAAHLHAGDAGVAGPVVFPMSLNGSTATLAATELSPEQLATLDAGGFYFNVHSAANPNGEIRGQIGREISIALMTGSQETLAVESAATGSGRLVLNPVTRALSGELELQGIEATAAHVHTGSFGSDGPILITLENHGGHGHFTVPAGTVLSPENVEKLRTGALYFNAHSAAHPGGEIRGQIGRRIFLAKASGAQQVPSTASAASGSGYVVYDSVRRSVQGQLSLAGMTASAAHIHQESAGSNGPVIVPLSAVADSGNWQVATTPAPVLSFTQAQALLNEGLYYNAHSTTFPDGEIRGQLRAAADDASPVMRIVSPAAGASLTRGEGRPGAGGFNGSGFSINLELITRSSVGIAAQEGLNIRDTSLLGQPNPKLPTLVVSFDADLIKPDGTLIAKGTNLAALFNIAGSDDTTGPGITLWAGWHVLESFPEGTTRVTMTASVSDAAGRVATDRVSFPVLNGSSSGQSLTPQTTGAAGDGVDDAEGPMVTMIAPRPGSSVSTGPLTGLPTPPANASLLFVQVSALDRAGAGIAVNENGEGKADADRGTIVDGSQIGAQGPNRNMPGLFFSFDAALRQPNGNLVPAGQNLAPLFNIVGSERDPLGVRTTAGWVVGGTLVLPAGQTSVKALARVTDNAGRSGSATSTFSISPVENGQNLTPAP